MLSKHARRPAGTAEGRVSATALAGAVLLFVTLSTSEAWCYSALRSWDVTATGSPTTVTWGFADDGTWIPANGTSDLVTFLDGVWGVSTASTDLTQRPWFSMYADSFDRWSQVSGLTFVYESADDGASLQTSPGARSVRADIRIGGKYIDGVGGALASTWLPDTGDMVIDTGDTTFWTNAVTGDLKARNLVMHEIGHGLGLMHIVSSDAALLMEPYNSKAFDGPQLDDIRGIQSLYGDKFEKSNNGLGNGTIGRATKLGSLAFGSTLSVGNDAAGDQAVLSGETDFVSITNAADNDYFSFTVAAPAYLNVSLTPWGGTFSQGPSAGLETIHDAASENNLSLAVYGPGGSPRLGLANRAPAGSIEVLTNISLPNAGTYYVRVFGSSDTVQLYELDLTLASPAITVSGDFNGDGEVNGRDFMLWQQSYGATGIGLPADGDGDGTVNATDLEIWQANFGQAGASALVSVPEPNCVLLVASILVCSVRRRWL